MPPRAARQRVHTGGRRLTVDLGAVGRPQALAHCTIWLAPLCGECADRGLQSSTNHPIINQSSTNHAPRDQRSHHFAALQTSPRLGPDPHERHTRDGHSGIRKALPPQGAGTERQCTPGQLEEAGARIRTARISTARSHSPRMPVTDRVRDIDRQ